MNHDAYPYIRDSLPILFREAKKEQSFSLIKSNGNDKHNPVQVKQFQQMAILIYQSQGCLIFPSFSNNQL
jgi:hypothetical protein